MQRVRHGLVVHMRQIHQHAETIHLEHDLLAEGRQAAPGGISRSSRPIEAAPVRQRHVARAEPVEHAQRAERVLDRVAAFDADQARDLIRAEVALDVGRRVRHRQRAWVLCAQSMNEIDLLERVDRRVGPGVHRRHGDIRGPELPPDMPGAKLRDIGHQPRLADGEVH